MQTTPPIPVLITGWPAKYFGQFFFCGFVFAELLLVIIPATFICRHNQNNSFAVTGAVIFAFLLFCVVLVAFLYGYTQFKQIKPGDIVAKGNDIVQRFSDYALVKDNSRWNIIDQGMILLSCVKQEIEVESHARPITENPKVRELFYKVKLTSDGTPASAIAIEALRQEYGSARDFVEYHLYEFNENCSRQLAKFFNPKDGVQQSEFRKLAENFLNEKFKKAGLAFKACTFSIG